MSLILLFAASLATAEPLSSQADRPYSIKICLRFSDDTAFTQVFADSVRWQVRDQLRNFFGPLAEVTMVDPPSWLHKLDGHDLRDWKLLPAELQAAGIDGKLFVFDLEYDDGKYRVAWRQFDGDVCQLGPHRTRTTSDRPWLAKSVCLAIKEDFAPVAMVTPGRDPATVAVEFRGSRTEGAARLAAWLGDDCVLQPFCVVRQRDATARVPIPNTVLRMSHKTGLTMARVESNRSQPWKQTARVVGFQAIRLHAGPGRIRLRLVDAESGAAVHSCQVMAGDRGFGALGDSDRLPAADPQGYVVSPKALANVAYVRIVQGGSGAIQFPMALVGDWNEQVCKVSIDRQAREKSDLVRQLSYLMQDVRALKSALDDYVQQVNGLNDEKRYEEALRESESAVDFAKRFRPAIKSGLADAERRAVSLPTAAAPRLARLKEQDLEIAKQQRDLQTLADNLRKTIAKNDAQSRADVLVDLGDQSLLDGDVDEAITKFEQALAEQPDQPVLKEKLAHIQEVWRIKNPRHKAARDFVVNEWAECELTDLDKRFPDAEQALEALEAVGDYLSLVRLSRVTEEQVGEIDDLIEQLADRNDEADRAEQEKYAALLDRISKFQERIFAAQKASTSGQDAGQGDPGETDTPPPPPKSPPEEEEEPPSA